MKPAWTPLALALAMIAPGAGAKSPLEPGDRAKRQCFWANQVQNFAAAGDRAVNLRAGVREVYRLEFIGRCPDIDWSDKIGVVARGGGLQICSGFDADIVAPSSIGPRRCAVRSIRRLTPQEVEALPPRERP